MYISLISRVRGPYSKLWTEFFPSFYGPIAKRVGHENKEGKKRGSITCRTDRANEANKMFIIWLCRLFRFWKGDRELAVPTATYGPGIDQSQQAKSVSHIINIVIVLWSKQLKSTAKVLLSYHSKFLMCLRFSCFRLKLAQWIIWRNSTLGWRTRLSSYNRNSQNRWGMLQRLLFGSFETIMLREECARRKSLQNTTCM